MSDIPRFGFQNLLGGKGIDTLVCRMSTEVTASTGSIYPMVYTMTITRSENDDVTTVIDHVSGSGFGHLPARNQLDQIAAGPATSLATCPNNIVTSGEDGAFVSTTSETISRETTSTGIYEFVTMTTLIAVVAITLVLSSRGIFLARKAVRAVTEETNEDDNLEYYENPHNGQVYWRIKKKAFR